MATISIENLLREMVERKASDLHLTVGSPPVFRIDGDIVPSQYPKLSPDNAQALVYSILNDEQKKKFENDHELDLSFGIPGVSRFRANAFLQRGNVSMAIRTIPFEILSFDKLGLPRIVSEWANYAKGLVLVTGPTGSGKSTTLAALINKINIEKKKHIVTVEDPIEYTFQHRSCIVNQRQVGSDTKSFSSALKYVLRQDPDVVMVGEMRDLETTEAALTIAETGHLTFGTLHTNSAVESINRIIDIFPSNRQSQVRSQLAFVLRAVLTQALIPKIKGGRALVMEILIVTPAVSALIREEKIHQIYNFMQAGKKFGMMTMNESLLGHWASKDISLDQAFANSRNPEELERMMEDYRKTKK
ncbi:type IV pilus twitching motility protein PilT [candidate division WOR-3 bacterium]|nr:type IV pilus twitching motility protein PilT [candidate division WOR-3 bacterium]